MNFEMNWNWTLLGCAQGPPLGLRVFSIYCGGLNQSIGYKFIAYADDSEMII